jgi:murein DD-endopeptidase MepM/ murein hydrolase activator NlpD
MNGLETLYGHLSRIDVEENQYVQSGEMIGRGGSTGHSDGPHLHFETRYKDFAFNPLLCLDPENSQVTVPHLILSKKSLNKLRYAEEELKAMRESKKYRKGSRSRSSSHKYHRVVKGESVHSIAKRYGVSRTHISKLNGISKYEKLRPGKKLRIR